MIDQVREALTNDADPASPGFADYEVDEIILRLIGAGIGFRPLFTREERAIQRLLEWCDEQDALPKGESMTTKVVRQMLSEEFR